MYAYIHTNVCPEKHLEVLGWPKNWCVFFCKIKDTFFIFTNNFIWIFWVCQLSPAWYNIDCSQLMSLFDRYQLQLVCPTVEHRPARTVEIPPAWNFINHFWHVWSVTAHTLYTAQIFFCVSVAFLPFLKLQSIICQKCCIFSSIFNIKMVHKISPMLTSFLSACWYDSCHNII